MEQRRRQIAHILTKLEPLNVSRPSSPTATPHSAPSSHPSSEWTELASPSRKADPSFHRVESCSTLLERSPFFPPQQGHLPRNTSLPQLQRPPSFSPRGGLLARRRSAPLAVEVETQPAAGALSFAVRHRRFSGGSPMSPQMAVLMPPVHREAIKQLPEGQKIFDLYTWNEVLQEEGDGGKVVVCQPKNIASRLLGRKYVMKIRSKETLVRDGIAEMFRKSQESLLNLPPHAGVLPLHEVLEDDHHYYIVMQRASGGSFLPSLASQFRDGVVPESAMKQLTRDILEAVGHVHSQGMLHRDIKPDNLVMQRQEAGERGSVDRPWKVALIDFDHADPEFDPGTPSRWHGFCGTVQFSAPEAIVGDFSQVSDLYSIGVILYLLMTGSMPYPDHVYEAYYENMRLRDRSPAAASPWKQGIERRRNWKGAVVQRMKETPISWTCDPWPHSPSCRGFCQSLLAFDPLTRPASASQALASEWLMLGEG